MMIHWGLYCLPAGEWKGRRMSDIGEWAQEYFRIPMAEYSRLAGVFNPVLFDAEEWVKLAEDAGGLYFPTLGEIAGYLRKELRDGDMLIVMGAGDVIKLDDILLENKS